jgi:hypothetical protein
MTPARSDDHAPDVHAGWAALTTEDPPVGRFDPADVADLPPAARRLLAQALTPGTAVGRTVVLAMEGDIRLRGWMPFRARQVLRVGTGMVWQATVHRGPLRFSGADMLWEGRGSLDFRLWGLVPVARASGPDTTRSAGDRLAAETVAWAPQGMLPALGAVWRHVDDTHAVVGLPIGDRTVEVTVTVDQHGALRELTMQRWGDPAEPGEFDLHPFGGRIDDHARHGGITIARTGTVGWYAGTPRFDEGEFIRWTITSAAFSTMPESAGHDPTESRATRP